MAIKDRTNDVPQVKPFAGDDVPVAIANRKSNEKFSLTRSRSKGFTPYGTSLSINCMSSVLQEVNGTKLSTLNPTESLDIVSRYLQQKLDSNKLNLINSAKRGLESYNPSSIPIRSYNEDIDPEKRAKKYFLDQLNHVLTSIPRRFVVDGRTYTVTTMSFLTDISGVLAESLLTGDAFIINDNFNQGKENDPTPIVLGNSTYSGYALIQESSLLEAAKLIKDELKVSFNSGLLSYLGKPVLQFVKTDLKIETQGDIIDTDKLSDLI